MPGIFDDIPAVSRGAGQAPPPVVWQEQPVPQGTYDLTSPKSPPGYAQTPEQAAQWDAHMSEPYVRIDPKTGQQFLRTPSAPLPQAQQTNSGDLFGDLPSAGGTDAPDFHAHSAADFGRDIGRSIGRGVPVIGSFLDEADAATNAGLAPLLEPLMDRIPGHDKRFDIGSGGSFDDRYQRALAMQRGLDATFDADHPAISTSAKVAGAVGSILPTALIAPAALSPASTMLGHGAALVPRIAAGAVDGALLGGAQGYGDGDGGALDPSRLASAGRGATFGAAAGGALPVGGALLSRGWDATGRRLADALIGDVKLGAPPSRAEALAALVDKAANDGAVPVVSTATGSAGADAAAARSAVPPASVKPSDAQGAYDRLWRAVERQGQTPAGAVETVGDLGPYGMMADAGDQTRDLARTVTNLPGKARTTAREALDLRQRGQLVDGEFAVRPASTRIADAAADGLGLQGRAYHPEIEQIVAAQKAEAGPAYAKAYQAAPVETGRGDSVRDALESSWAEVTGKAPPEGAPLSEFTGSPVFQKAYDRARGISEKEFVTQPDGSSKIVPLPAEIPKALDWRTLDLIKQGLDDMVKEGRVQGIGGNEQGALKGYLSRFVSKLDRINPDYADARAAFAGPARMVDAADAGRAFFREDAPTNAKAMADLTDGEKDMFRIGALQALRDRLGNASVTYDAASKAGFLQPAQLERFKELFPTPKAYGDFVNMLSREKTMFDTRAAVTGNSTTARQLADMSEAHEDPLATVGHVAAAAHGDAASIGKLVTGLFKADPAKMRPGTADALANLLFNMDTAALPTTRTGLAEAQRRAALAGALTRSATPAAATAAATASASRP